MNLKEALEDITDETVIYIGARTGWLYIGTKREYVANYEEINRKNEKELNDKIKELEESIPKTNGQVARSTMKKMLYKLYQIKEQMTDLYSRKVRFQYEGIKDKSWRIIIEGDEVTRVWMREEYEEMKGIFFGSMLVNFGVKQRESNRNANKSK